MEEWRLLLTGAKDAFTNMAIDESVLRSLVNENSKNTIRLYQWVSSTVSIGYFQGIEEEVDLRTCKEKKVDVVRRITGGGAVFHDYNGEITYSVAVNESHPKMPKDIIKSSRVLCSGLVNGFKILGLNAEFIPINDIVVNNKKISGSAHTRRFGGILQHGTILYDVNPKLMFSLLKVPNEKIRDKMIKNVEERVTSIKKEKGNIDKEDVIDAMIKGFESALDIKLVKGELTQEELRVAEELRSDKYGTKEWNFKR
ncbi:MAG: Lipoate-protein ligase A subunit 1 [Candidatus Argoarchaeum ethanivorans]|uniref:Lipoate-protein ligase A subunit 1 n=1 Tax=Candidatus Argoarchaeum ethanivorans TaxID=2608793 RepID=A0A811T8V7_9EURY|nr:MAG: Lipoate-protein ligase A subunit 1 [Candidatus Argoarchaeum ethanivorans]